MRIDDKSLLVSVVLTTYNRKDLLKETINSILDQTYQNFELIVIDNYSDYDFYSHIKLFNDHRIRAFQNTNNGIISINRNYGIKLAMGKYVAFCDDDDLWVENKLEEQLKKINEHNVDMVFSVAKHFGSIDIFSDIYGLYPIPFNVKVATNELLTMNTIIFSSVVLKKEILDKHDGFNIKQTYMGIEDYDLWLRVSKTSSIIFMPNIHVFYRIHPNMTQLNNPMKDVGLKELYKEHGGQYIYRTFSPSRHILLRLLRSLYHKFVEILIMLKFFEIKLFKSKFIKMEVNT